MDQGYAFKVITHLSGMEQLPDLAYSSARERRELLQQVLLKNEDAAGLRLGMMLIPILFLKKRECV